MSEIKYIDETINNVVDVPAVSGLLKVIAESGNEYTTFIISWKSKIGMACTIAYTETKTEGRNGKVWVNKRIVENPAGQKPSKAATTSPQSPTASVQPPAVPTETVRLLTEILAVLKQISLNTSSPEKNQLHSVKIPNIT